MLPKEILIFVLFVANIDLSKCFLYETKTILEQKGKDMNIMKMFDKFFYIRYADKFFIHNMKHTLTDKYLTTYYTPSTGGLSPTLRDDLSMHAIYFENTGWYSNSFTELFSILYLKYLASDYVVEFRNCNLYYELAEQNEDMRKKCQKVARYFLSFVEFGLKKILERTREMLKLVVESEDDKIWNDHYEKIFDSVKFLFQNVKDSTLYFPLANISRLMKNKNEIFQKLWLREKRNLLRGFSEARAEYLKKLRVKYFFRNLLFGMPMKNDNEILEKIHDDYAEISSLNYEEIQQKTINFWQLANTLVEKIEKTDPRTTRSNFDDPDKSGFITSNATQLLRYLELEKLSMYEGIDKRNDSEFLLGTPNTILQVLIEPTDILDKQMQFIFVSYDELLSTPMKSGYPQLTQTMKESDFSGQEFISAEEEFESNKSAVQKSQEGYTYSQNKSNGQSVPEFETVSPPKQDISSSTPHAQPPKKHTITPHTKPESNTYSQNKSNGQSVPEFERVSPPKQDISLSTSHAQSPKKHTTTSHTKPPSNASGEDFSEFSHFMSEQRIKDDLEYLLSKSAEFISKSMEHDSKQEMNSGQDLDELHKNPNISNNQLYPIQETVAVA